MTDLMNDERVDKIVGDQCQYGQESFKGDPVRKATGWLSNPNEIQRNLANGSVAPQRTNKESVHAQLAADMQRHQVASRVKQLSTRLSDAAPYLEDVETS